MNLQKQPNFWSCLPTSVAMALDLPVDEIIKLVGHDGSEVLWPDLKEPLKRRGFHIQEMILVAHRLGRVMVPFEARPQSLPEDGVEPYEVLYPFEEVLLNNSGVLLGIGRYGLRHAAAWDGTQVYDPNGRVYQPEEFGIEVFYLIK